MQFHNKTTYVWMGILPLKKRVNRDKCSFATKQRMFGVFAIDEILRYRGTWFPSSRTLCHPGWEGKYFNIDSTGPTRNSESESENEMRIQCKHQKTW